ncbi:MAG TPA: hypothetical protein VK807_23000 [Gemmatimonadaceae bacterium]|jgi:hypothetical protein|nr:hypothetical protein [Gemmatimonadaceae bacterium]
MRVACFAAAVITVSAQAQWPAPGTIQHLGRLGPSDAREAARGIVSPDGTLFAYEVVHQHYRRIWLLNLTTGETRSLTPDPGVRYSLSWSADSRRLAYMYNQNTVRVADVDSSREREIFRRDPPSQWDRPYIEGVTWDADSALSFDLYDVLWPGGRSVRWIAQLDGSNAHIDDRAVPRQRFASHRCCGGGSYGVWMGARCIAGPVEYGPRLLWSPDQQTLVIASDGRLYAMRVPSGHAERVADAPGNIHTVTMTRAGALAITTLAAGDSLGDLWLATPPFRTVAQDTIPRCPGPEARVTEFIRTTRRGKPLSVTEYPVAKEQFALFAAAYPGMDVSPTYVGAVYHGRIGWLFDTSNWGFRVTAGDSGLFSQRTDSILGHETGQSTYEWREWLLHQRATPPDAIVRLARETAPISGPPDTWLRGRPLPPWALTQLAEISAAHATEVILQTHLGDDADAITALARMPRYRYDKNVQGAARQRLVALMPRMLADSSTPEPDLFELVAGTVGYGWDRKTQDALLGHRAVRGSMRALAVLGAVGYPEPQSTAAQTLLAAHGVSLEGEILALIDAADTLPPDVLERLEAISPVVQRSYRLQRALRAQGIAVP